MDYYDLNPTPPVFKHFDLMSGDEADTTKQNISQHIDNILNDGELNDSTHKDFLLVRQEGNRQVQRNIVHYNLDMIIALGYLQSRG